jgi:hypothetical protein
MFEAKICKESAKVEIYIFQCSTLRQIEESLISERTLFMLQSKKNILFKLDFSQSKVLSNGHPLDKALIPSSGII